ncbi:endothelin-converting enzyme-like 1 isoform X3 [Dermacentor albipictus]|uniref:endothelin-converting enzyme-like 1 isoform X3 n=1 Tax=Dermacentor albipictus TaxID=60249 RepID=UPI0031FD6249
MRKLTDSEIMQIQDGMAVMSPLVGDYSGDRHQLYKLVTLSLASAGSFVLLLVIFPLLVRTTGHRSEESWYAPADAGDTNSSFGNGLRRSLDYAAAKPCDDFYAFVCGHWPRAFPRLAHQFHLLDNRVRVAALRRVAALAWGAVNMTVTEKVGRALVTCLGEHESEHDHSNVVAQLLHSLGIDWPSLRLVADRTRTFNFLQVFLTLSQNMGLPLFFQFLPELDLRRPNRTVLTLSPGWLPASLADKRSVSSALFLAAVYGRDDLSQRLERVYQRVALAAAALHQSSQHQAPFYTTVEGVGSFSRHLPSAKVLLAMINLNFRKKNQVTLTDDVYVTGGGKSAFRLAAMFAAEVASDDAEAAGAFVSTLLLRHLAVPSSAKLSSMLQMSKYRCFELVQDVAPHAMSLFLAEAERKNTSAKLHGIEDVVLVPDDLYDEALLERHYASLPVFRSPFVRSYLSALRGRADRAKASLHRRVSTARRMSHRLPMLAAKPLLLPFYSLLFVPVASMLPPIVVRESPEATYAALGHLVARELVSALHLSASDADRNGLLVNRRFAAAVSYTITCLHRSSSSSPSQTRRQVGALAYQRIEEVYADVVGLQAAMRALRAATPSYRPLKNAAVFQNWTSAQLFYLSACFKWCAFDTNEVEGTVGSHRERCNLPVAEEPGFLAAFNCSANSKMARQRKGCFRHAL